MDRVKLEDVSERGSSNLAQKDIEGLTGNYPIYGASGYIGMVDFYHQEKDYIAVVKDGAGIGRTMFLPAKSSVIGTLQYIIPKENIIPKYLYYAVKNMRLEKYYTGATIPHIYYKDYKKETFRLLDMCEQQKVVSILEKIEKIIGEEQQKFLEFDKLIKSRFVETFGDISRDEYKYETRKLGDVANVGSSHRVFTNEFVENGIPFYRGTEIGELANGQTPTDPYYIAEAHYLRLASDETKPQIGDLLMPSICNKGQIWMVDTDEPFYYKDGRVLCISADREIYDTKYLQYYMRIKTEIEYPKLGSGSTFAEFKIFLLKDLDILTPPKAIQEQFATFVHQVDKLKFLAKKSLEKLELMQKALMQQFFG